MLKNKANTLSHIWRYQGSILVYVPIIWNVKKKRKIGSMGCVFEKSLMSIEIHYVSNTEYGM